jgi:hypothetical protein
VATGCGGLRLHPAVGEGCRRWRGTGSSNPSPSSGESSANRTLEEKHLIVAADDHAIHPAWAHTARHLPATPRWRAALGIYPEPIKARLLDDFVGAGEDRLGDCQNQVPWQSAADGDPGLWPVPADTADETALVTAYLRARGRLSGTQQHGALIAPPVRPARPNPQCGCGRIAARFEPIPHD